MEQLIPALSLVIFIVTIVVGIKTKLNLGILSMAVAFIFGLFVVVEGGSISWDLGGEPITSLFPFDIFWPVLTVSLMLNIANNNGTFNIIINKMAGLARGRRALIPIIVYVITVIAVSVGAANGAGVNILLITIAANIARDQKIDPVFMMMAVITATTVGIGSPVSIIGIICNNYSMEYFGVNLAPGFMYIRALLMSVVSFAIIYIIFRGWKLERWPVAEKKVGEKLTAKQKITMLGLLVFVVLALVLKMELGLSAITVATVLLLLGCADQKKVIADVPWSALIMISGVCMLIGVVREAGGMDLLVSLLQNVMNSVTIKPIYALIGGLLSMVTSITSVILPSMCPTIPALAASAGVNPYALFTALAFGANATCGCPVSSLGGMAVGIMSGNKEWDADTLFKKMLLCTVVLLVAAAVMAGIGFAG